MNASEKLLLIFRFHTTSEVGGHPQHPHPPPIEIISEPNTLDTPLPPRGCQRTKRYDHKYTVLLTTAVITSGHTTNSMIRAIDVSTPVSSVRETRWRLTSNVVHDFVIVVIYIAQTRHGWYTPSSPRAIRAMLMYYPFTIL